MDNGVRVGLVTAVDKDKRIARVVFMGSKIPSDWLALLDNLPIIPDQDVPQETEEKNGHKHELKIKSWLPKVNDQVLVLCLPDSSAGGFILGRVQAWQ